MAEDDDMKKVIREIREAHDILHEIEHEFITKPVIFSAHLKRTITRATKHLISAKKAVGKD